MNAESMQAPVALPGTQVLEQRSPKRYATAVAISSALGFVGAQHFYLGRWGEGLIDVGLTLGWVIAFAIGEPLWGVLFAVADFGHALVCTILLLTGSFRDGEGRRVCYPGQKLGLTKVG